VTYLAIFGLFAIWYPDFGVYQKSLAEVSAAALVFPMWWLGALLLVVVLLFQPRKHPHIKHAWGIWTVCLSVAAIVIATYFDWIRW
jgi:hypothetical protein